MHKMNTSKLKGFYEKGRYMLVYAFVYILIVVFMAFVNKYTGSLDFLDSSNSIFINPSEFNEDFSIYELTDNDDQYIYTYTINIPGQAYKNLDGDEYRLIINGVKDNAIKVWFNDQLIISLGDLEEGHSMIRNNHVYGSIEPSMIKSDNLLKIQTYADSRTGTEEEILFTEKASGERVIRLLNLFNERLITVGIGFMLMSVLFVLIIYLLNRKGNKLLLFLALATFFTSFYFFDHIPINYLTHKYLIFKKIFLLGLSLGIFFYGVLLYHLIQKKYIMIVPVAQLVYYLCIMRISKDMIEFKIYYNYFYSSLLFIVIIFFVSIILNVRKDRKMFILLLHFFAMIVLGVLRLDIGLKSNYFSLAMPIYIMVAIGFLPMVVTFDLLLEKDLEILQENELKNLAHKQSMTDDLTGVWNKRYLESRLHSLGENSVVALLDLDNLKYINDTYGHLAGDTVICCMVETVKNNTRRSDDICRYGGDEFIIIFENCTVREAVVVIEKIRISIAEKSISFNQAQLTTSISTGLCAVSNELKGEKIIECADKQLYIAKEKGKNRTEFVDSSKKNN